MATMVRSDIYCCLGAQTIGKNKKIKETKDPSQNHSKTIENNQKNQKNQRSQEPGETSCFGQAFPPIIVEIVDFGLQLNILLPEC